MNKYPKSDLSFGIAVEPMCDKTTVEWVSTIYLGTLSASNKYKHIEEQDIRIIYCDKELKKVTSIAFL